MGWAVVGCGCDTSPVTTTLRTSAPAATNADRVPAAATGPRRLARLLRLAVLAGAFLLAAGCSDDTVTLSGGSSSTSTGASADADGAPTGTEQERADLVEAWTDEIFRDGDRTMTVSRARCIAQGGLDVLGFPLATTVLAQDQATEDAMGVIFLAEDAAGMAEVIVGCQDDDRRWRELGTETAPFAASADIDCFVRELDAVEYLTLDLRDLSEEAAIVARRAATTCGLI